MACLAFARHLAATGTRHLCRGLAPRIPKRDHSCLTKCDAAHILLGAKRNTNLSYADLAQKLKVNKVWLVAAILGQHPISEEKCRQLLEALQITGSTDQHRDLIETLGQVPHNRAESKSRDPVVRRLNELVDTYGDAIKALIREEAGDGIMSAINCTIHLDKVTVKKGNQEEVRIVLTVDGKFLPYHVEHGDESKS